VTPCSLVDGHKCFNAICRTEHSALQSEDGDSRFLQNYGTPYAIYIASHSRRPQSISTVQILQTFMMSFFPAKWLINAHFLLHIIHTCIKTKQNHAKCYQQSLSTLCIDVPIVCYSVFTKQSAANNHSLVMEVHISYGMWKFIIVFTKASHWPLSWAKWILSTPLHPIP
jgi:hypothetical protein